MRTKGSAGAGSWPQSPAEKQGIPPRKKSNSKALKAGSSKHKRSWTCRHFASASTPRFQRTCRRFAAKAEAKWGSGLHLSRCSLRSLRLAQVKLMCTPCNAPDETAPSSWSPVGVGRRRPDAKAPKPRTCLCNSSSAQRTDLRTLLCPSSNASAAPLSLEFLENPKNTSPSSIAACETNSFPNGCSAKLTLSPPSVST